MACFTLGVQSRFEAAHHLRSYKGQPEAVHGHSWVVESELRAAQLDGEGMAYDFVEIKTVQDRLAARFDHQHINEIPPFDRESPTTEHLARWFFQELSRQLPKAPLAAVTVWEGPTCSARYEP
jgi:6-pyruvoyltetrahydropterin/6-carboxytetrahydropterin synthase